MHRPDFDVPIDETLSALTDLVRQGKVLYIGCSTYPAWKVMEALMVSEQKGYARYVTEQPPYNLLDRRIENELVPLALCSTTWGSCRGNHWRWAFWPGAIRWTARFPRGREPHAGEVFSLSASPVGDWRLGPG